MNRRSFLRSTIALATVAGAASISVLTPSGHALAYRPLTSNGDGDGDSKTRNKRKSDGKHRKRRSNRK
ncbi:MAG: hypothetical protein ACRDJC_05345 [Thermomicrobiales bacterium]